jgi:hypothetical protein
MMAYGRQILGLVALTLLSATWLMADEPPALNPFGSAASQQRDDAVPGCLELSDGAIRPGMIYMTRDKRLKIYDEQLQRQREVPLQAVKQIECKVKREWMEKEWKFKETTSDKKLHTGYSYPAREYLHTITLNDGRTITGPLAAIVYVEPPRYAPARPEGETGQPEPERFLLNKRNKGVRGQELKELIYVKKITLGKEALEQGMTKQTTPKHTDKKQQKTQEQP